MQMRRIGAAGIVVTLAVVAPGCSRSARTVSTGGTSTVASAPALRENPASASDGASIYVTNCSSCHQADGKGIPGAFPPLAHNPVVTGDPLRVIAIVKYGMSGKIVVACQHYDGTMPAWGQLVSDGDVAAVVSYIRAAWHNDTAAVSPAQVHAASTNR